MIILFILNADLGRHLCRSEPLVLVSRSRLTLPLSDGPAQLPMAQQNNDYKLGATFFPGLDDYYMPHEPVDVVSPAPQRITPEVPGQIQDSLAALELDSQEIPRKPVAHGRQEQDRRRSSAVSPLEMTPQTMSTPFPPGQAPPTVSVTAPAVVAEEPNFSPFPKLQSRPPNIPPTYEEREATLEGARLLVLNSSDPEMQLAWAEDALAYADNCVDYDSHISSVEGHGRAHTPGVEKQLRIEAVNIVMCLAEQGHPKAEFMRGMWYEFGKFGYVQNKPEAYRAYKRAAAKGYSRAEYRMGIQYESTGEPMKALQHYKIGENLGDSASCYRVGMMCLMGQLGQSKDFVAGVRLVQYSADTADENAPQGAYVFGMLLAGELTQAKVPEAVLPPDLSAAKKYMEKAAYLGFAKAQVKMGSAYELCSLGCPFDPAIAIHYMSLAARQGEPEAEMAISKWFLCGYENLFKKNNEVAYQYALRAAFANLDTAEFAMGYFNEVGIHVPVNISKARDWYEKASKNGNADAKGRLDALSASQHLTKVDHEKVALNRIRSQYGSRRGSHPERFTQPAQLPKVSEGGPRISTPSGLAQGRVTPYPVDDRPLVLDRPPVSRTPYPVDDMLAYGPQRESSQSAFFVAEAPPYANASAQRPNSRVAYGASNQAFGRTQGLPQQRSNQPLHRPVTAIGTPLPQPRPAVPDARQPSTVSLPPEGRLSVTQPGIVASRPHDGPLDIGFTAPIDARADARNRTPALAGRSRPMLVDQRRLSADPPSKAGIGSVMPLRSSSRPPESSSAPSSRVPSVSHEVPSAASSKPPAKTPGAQTFEEMGVPPSKKEHDCVSRFSQPTGEHD